MEGEAEGANCAPSSERREAADQSRDEAIINAFEAALDRVTKKANKTSELQFVFDEDIWSTAAEREDSWPSEGQRLVALDEGFDFSAVVGKREELRLREDVAELMRTEELGDAGTRSGEEESAPAASVEMGLIELDGGVSAATFQGQERGAFRLREEPDQVCPRARGRSSVSSRGECITGSVSLTVQKTSSGEDISKRVQHERSIFRQRGTLAAERA